MSESEPIKFPRHPGAGCHGGGQASQGEMVAFSRVELSQILRLYGFRVAAGDWRDYAIDMMRDRAVFSVFRHSADVPLYRIEKKPRLARRQGAFSVISASGRILRRGRNLQQVLRVLEPRPRLTLIS